MCCGFEKMLAIKSITNIPKFLTEPINPYGSEIGKIWINASINGHPK